MTKHYSKITKHTRAGRAGKLIKCPRCEHKKRIYHLCWTALSCQGCHEMIDKYDWYIEESMYRKKENS